MLYVTSLKNFRDKDTLFACLTPRSPQFWYNAISFDPMHILQVSLFKKARNKGYFTSASEVKQIIIHRSISGLTPFFARAKRRKPRSSLFAPRKRLLRRLVCKICTRFLLGASTLKTYFHLCSRYGDSLYDCCMQFPKNSRHVNPNLFDTVFH